MKYYLVKFSMDWADEYDVRSISVCDSVRYEHEKQVAETNSEYIFDEIGFGTNESFFEVSMGDLYESYTFVEISESTYRELVPQLASTYSDGYGTWFRWPSSLLEEYDLEEAEDK